LVNNIAIMVNILLIMVNNVAIMVNIWLILMIYNTGY
jgi:hypothetical protein